MKELILFDFDDNKTKTGVDLDDLSEILRIDIQVISGDEIARITYKNGQENEGSKRMSSVLIKGMKKPETCSKCPFCQFGGLDLKLRCLVTDESIINFDVKEKRAGNCPLVEIPPHGRLIDASEMAIKFSCLDIDITTVKNLHECLMEIPTVIESEEQEHECE